MKCYFCESDAQGQCQNCGCFICHRHSRIARGGLRCERCAADIHYEEERAEERAREKAREARVKEAERKRSAAEAVQRRKEEAAALQEKSRQEDIKVWALIGMTLGGILGFVVGFFSSCNPTPGVWSLDVGAWLGTLLLYAVIGAAIGLAVGILSSTAD